MATGPARRGARRFDVRAGRVRAILPGSLQAWHASRADEPGRAWRGRAAAPRRRVRGPWRRRSSGARATSATAWRPPRSSRRSSSSPTLWSPRCWRMCRRVLRAAPPADRAYCKLYQTVCGGAHLSLERDTRADRETGAALTLSFVACAKRWTHVRHTLINPVRPCRRRRRVRRRRRARRPRRTRRRRSPT
jgi:hypothetical protein